MDSVARHGRELPLRAELLALREQDVVELARDAAQPVDILLDGHLIGRGALVAVGDNFGVRITEIDANAAAAQAVGQAAD